MFDNFMKYLLWFLVIMWMGVIFFLSNRPAYKSGNDSKNVLNSIVRTSTKITNDVGITNFSRSDLKQFVNNYNGVFREFMHSFVYFILAILLLLALKYNNIKNDYIISLFICFIYAFSDEVHQIFIVGRTFEIIDLFLDLLGSIFGIILYRLFLVILVDLV